MVSTKQTYVNDSPKGDPVKVSYTTSSNASNWVSISSGSFKVSENTSDSGRLATIRFTQAESGKFLVVGIQQEAKEKESKAYFLAYDNLQRTLDQGKSTFNIEINTPNATGTFIKLVSTDEDGNKLQFSVNSTSQYLKDNVDKDEDGSNLAQSIAMDQQLGRPINLTQATHSVLVDYRPGGGIGDPVQTGIVTLTQNNTNKTIVINISDSQSANLLSEDETDIIPADSLDMMTVDGLIKAKQW